MYDHIVQRFNLCSINFSNKSFLRFASNFSARRI